jgi:ubiquinone/menaquinone biosynthesis C-methylase UbiE
VNKKSMKILIRKKNLIHEIEKQRLYYKETAKLYNEMHVNEQNEHTFALAFLVAALDYFQIKSILDIGSGTGRAIKYIKKHRPDIRILGIEPVEALREVGYSQGLSSEYLIDGDANMLQFNNEEFDLVCEFGVLHHIKNPELAISEMLRVAKKAIFISDSNNFGQGSYLSRTIKQIINSFGLWKVADLIKTNGKGFIESEGDGIAYSYSVFNNYKQIKKQCKRIHVFNTKDGDINYYKTASHVALLGIKK